MFLTRSRTNVINFYFEILRVLTATFSWLGAAEWTVSCFQNQRWTFNLKISFLLLQFLYASCFSCEMLKVFTSSRLNVTSLKARSLRSQTDSEDVVHLTLHHHGGRRWSLRFTFCVNCSFFKSWTLNSESKVQKLKWQETSGLQEALCAQSLVHSSLLQPAEAEE